MAKKTTKKTTRKRTFTCEVCGSGNVKHRKKHPYEYIDCKECESSTARYAMRGGKPLAYPASWGTLVAVTVEPEWLELLTDIRLLPEIGKDGPGFSVETRYYYTFLADDGTIRRCLMELWPDGHRWSVDVLPRSIIDEG